MLIHPGKHIGDSWYYVEGDLVHCFYLTCPEDVERHTAWDVAHATSRDLRRWDLQGVVLERGHDADWDGRCLATGSVVRVGGRYVMAYTARWNEPGVATGLAFSNDLYQWAKSPQNPATRPDGRFYEATGSGTRHWTHWRDPFLMGSDEFTYQLMCARRNDGPIDERGTVGVARSRDLTTWEVLPPLEIDPVAQEFECPQIRIVGGRWYLVFSAFEDLTTGLYRKRFGRPLRAGTYALVGSSPFGPFEMRSGDPIVATVEPNQPYASQLVAFGGGTYLLGTVWSDSEHDCVCDPILVVAGEEGLGTQPLR